MVASSAQRPVYPEATDEYDPEVFSELLRMLRQRDRVIPIFPIGDDPYTPSNVTTTRTYDADTSSVEELADVLGTLIADLQTAGYLK